MKKEPVVTPLAPSASENVEHVAFPVETVVLQASGKISVTGPAPMNGKPERAPIQHRLIAVAAEQSSDVSRLGNELVCQRRSVPGRLPALSHLVYDPPLRWLGPVQRFRQLLALAGLSLASRSLDHLAVLRGLSPGRKLAQAVALPASFVRWDHSASLCLL